MVCENCNFSIVVGPARCQYIYIYYQIVRLLHKLKAPTELIREQIEDNQYQKTQPALRWQHRLRYQKPKTPYGKDKVYTEGFLTDRFG